MKRALSILALAALCACGGGGGSGGGFAPVASTPTQTETTAPAPVPQAPMVAPTVVSPNCVTIDVIYCDLVPSDQAIGVGVPAGSYVAFTNRTGAPLQIVEIDAFTAERRSWSEYCAYLGDLNDSVTWQRVAGKGEVGCSTKNIGEDYAPIRFGAGLVVAPGEVVVLNSHTEPAPTNHTYALRVQALSNGGQSWRQPQRDEVITCDGQMQYTAPTPWKNTTGRDVQLSGASIYSESPSSKTPNTVNGGACISILLEGGAQKYSNCDTALRTRGEVSFPPVTVAPGEYIAAQAANACASPSHWNWAAFLQVR